MKKQLFTLAALALALGASAQKSTIELGGEVLTIDTIFHAPVGPGTTQTQLHLTGVAPLDVFYLTIDKTTPGVSLHSICPGGKIAGTNRTSLMAQNASDDEHLYFAGTNADFYWTGGKATDGTSLVGTPTYSAAVGGEVYKSSGSGYQFSVDAEGIARVCRLSWHNGTASAGDASVPFRGINVDASNNAVTLYTTRGWTSPCQGQFAGACSEVTGRLVEGDAYVTGGTFRIEVTSTATSTGDTRIPADGCVLMARGNARSFIDGLAVGDIVTLDQVITTPEGERITPMEIVSGNPKNVGGGVNLNSEAERGDAIDRHPRTGIGVSADGNTIIMMVVDGRGASRGVSTGMLGDLMIRAGAAEAVNLDGGGSSTLYTAALGVRNKCSDGNERAVGNGIFAVVEGNVTDTEVASLAFADWRFDAPQMGIYNPRVFAFNAAGVLIDNDFKDFTLSCPETLGEIVGDGKTLLATGTVHGVLTASFGNATAAKIPVYITPTEVKPRLEAVLLDNTSDYTIELEATVNGNTVAVSPLAFDWQSSDVAVATVDDEGTVHPVAPGSCTVTGTRGEMTFALNVTVESIPGDIIPVEEDSEAWEIKKTLVSSVTATPMEHGFMFDYTMGSSNRGSKITLNDRKNLTARPDAIQIRVQNATVNPSQIAVTFRAANQRVSTNVSTSEFAAEGTTTWVIPFADHFDTTDAGIYPIEFISLAVTLKDPTKSTGHIEIPGIEVLYTKGEAGVDTPVVAPAEGTEAWFTIDGIALPQAPGAAGLYIRRTASGAEKVIVR
ncbi:MAG: phosphodiester glycosidase family protein [Muribaculaceae bacterium]|nr:phosphodiester glycosidase family protein [Muribaculaceae bacterium]